MLAWKASSSCSPRRSGMSSVLRGGGWRGDMSISWKQAKHTLQAKRAVIFRHLIYINQPTCYSVPKSLMNLIKSHLLSRREWSHTYEPVFTLANTAVQPHVKLFVRLRSQCNWVQEWHVIIIIIIIFFFFTEAQRFVSDKLNSPVNVKVSFHAPCGRLILHMWLKVWTFSPARRNLCITLDDRSCVCVWVCVCVWEKTLFSLMLSNL